MRHDRCERVRRVIRAHGNEAVVEFSLDLARKNNRDFDIKGAVRHIDLQAVVPNGGDVFLIDINENNVIPRSCEAATNDAADRPGSDNDHTHSFDEPPRDFASMPKDMRSAASGQAFDNSFAL
jgi:hypothetical protein